MATTSVLGSVKTTLKTIMFPSCCGLKIVHKLKCLGLSDPLSEKHAEAFDSLVKVGTAEEGNWYTYGKAPETVAIITSSKRYNKPEEFKKQMAFFKKKGWVQLASWKSMESGGTNYMWGSPGIRAGFQEEKGDPITKS